MPQKKSGTKMSGMRLKKTRVKTAKKRSASSTRWLERQLNDPYVAKARQEGYRSRAAYKLQELDDQYRFLKPGMTVVDLGSAPGSWLQVVLEKLSNKHGLVQGRIVAVDLLEIEPMPGVIMIKGDFLSEDIEMEIVGKLKAKPNTPIFDVVLSDMAANTTGHRQTDYLRTMALCETALDYALRHLKPGGTFITKVFRGGAEKSVLDLMKKRFREVKHVKPSASRDDSREMYVIALGFR